MKIMMCSGMGLVVSIMLSGCVEQATSYSTGQSAHGAYSTHQRADVSEYRVDVNEMNAGYNRDYSHRPQQQLVTSENAVRSQAVGRVARTYSSQS